MQSASRFRSISAGKLTLLFTMTSKVSLVVLSAASAAVVALAGGQQELGYFALLRVIPALFVLLTGFGISNSYPFLIKRAANSAQRVFRSGALAFLLIVVFQIGIWLLAAPFLRHLFFKDFELDLVLLIGCIAPFQLLHLHGVNLLRSIDRVRSANLIGLAVEGVLLGALCWAAFSSQISNQTLVLACVLSWSSVCLVMLIVLWRMGYPFKPLIDKNLFLSSVRFGIKSQAASAVNLLNYRLDQLIIGGLLGAAELGLYAVASKAAELFRFFAKSVSFVVEPLFASRGSVKSRRFIQKSYPKVFLVNALLMAFSILVVPLAIPIVFGDWSTGATQIFYILVIGLIAGGGNGLIAAYNKAMGVPEKNLNAFLIGIGVAVTANFLLIPRIGVIGAAWASVITQITVTLLFGAQYYFGTKKMKGVQSERHP